MLLAHELVERPRPHAGSQRFGPAAVGGPVFVKQVDELNLLSIILPEYSLASISSWFLCEQMLRN
jgi:hypothetical protein